MTLRDTWTEVADVESLTALLGEPTAAARKKTRQSLTELDEYYGPSYAENMYRNPVA